MIKAKFAQISERLVKNHSYTQNIAAKLLGVHVRALPAYVNEAAKIGHYFEHIKDGKQITVKYHGQFKDLNLTNPVQAAIAKRRVNPLSSAAFLPMG